MTYLLRRALRALAVSVILLSLNRKPVIIKVVVIFIHTLSGIFIHISFLKNIYSLSHNN